MDSMIDGMIDYSRQSDMGIHSSRLLNRRHIVVGCGGIGYWTALFLALLGANHICLIDGDRCNSTNLPRLPIPLRYRNDFKVKTLKATIRLLRPTVYVVAIPMHLSPETSSQLNWSDAIVWDCTDDARTQKEMSDLVTCHGSFYYKMAYEGWQIAGYPARAFKGLWIDEDYRAGYVTNRANVLSSVLASALGILNVLTNDNPLEYELNAREIICQKQNGQ